MPYDTIQDQGLRRFLCAKMADFKWYLLRQYAYNQKTNGELILQTISEFNLTDFCYSSSFLASRDLMKSRLAVLYVLINMKSTI